MEVAACASTIALGSTVPCAACVSAITLPTSSDDVSAVIVAAVVVGAVVACDVPAVVTAVVISPAT